MPRRAELTIAVIVIAVVLLGDVRGAIGFSSFGVLLYYGVANVAAFRQRPAARRFPRVLQIIGLAGCVVLAATLPWPSVALGAGVVAVGVGYRAILLSRRR